MWQVLFLFLLTQISFQSEYNPFGPKLACKKPIEPHDLRKMKIRRSIDVGKTFTFLKQLSPRKIVVISDNDGCPYFYDTMFAFGLPSKAPYGNKLKSGHIHSESIYTVGSNPDAIYSFKWSKEKLSRIIKSRHFVNPIAITKSKGHKFVLLRDKYVLQLTFDFRPHRLYTTSLKEHRSIISTDSGVLILTKNKIVNYRWISYPEKMKMNGALHLSGDNVFVVRANHSRLWVLNLECDLAIVEILGKGALRQIGIVKLPISNGKCNSIYIDEYCLLWIGTSDGKLHLIEKQ